MASYLIVHTENPSKTEKESVKLAAARAVYAELLKYRNSKITAKVSE
ncbi:MAG: hypothetical protein HDT43_01625 [Ruminococcaceae bacterium]|nr:hypothetical protein [Oscillospiraceae bacterium]